MIFTKLSDEEQMRYARHISLPEIGREGQEKLKDSKILVVGLGGLGNAAAIYLASAGVGKLGFSDFDYVSLDNLQRQIMFSEKDINKLKTDAAKARIESINPNVKVIGHDKLDSRNAMEIIKKYDIVLDCSDNFSARYLVNDACFFLEKPDVYGSALQFEGHASVFYAKKGPCYRCLAPRAPEMETSCELGGVLGALPGVVGAIQAIEAIKIAIGKGEPLMGRLLIFDSYKMGFRELVVSKNPRCRLCGTHEIKKLEDVRSDVTISDSEFEITPEGLRKQMEEGVPVILIDVREPWEHEIAKIEGSVLIPLGDLERRVNSLPRDKEIVVYCHHGIRSSHAAQFLRERGFKGARTLAGGINAWSRKIDQKVPRY